MAEGIWVGAHGGVCWAYFHGDFSADEFQRYVEKVQASMAQPSFAGAMLTVAHSPKMPSATQRKQLTDLVTTGAAEKLKRHAIVSDSVVARGVVTAMNWVARKPFEERIFATPEAAIAWLREQIPDVSASLWEAIVEEVEPARRWK
jgi:hypothetical protein